MVELNVKKVFEESGVTKYYVCKITGLSYTNLQKLLDGTTKSMSFQILDKLCEALNCNVEDILVRHPYKQKNGSK